MPDTTAMVAALREDPRAMRLRMLQGLPPPEAGPGPGQDLGQAPVGADPPMMHGGAPMMQGDAGAMAKPPGMGMTPPGALPPPGQGMGMGMGMAQGGQPGQPGVTDPGAAPPLGSGPPPNPSEVLRRQIAQAMSQGQLKGEQPLGY